MNLEPMAWLVVRVALVLMVGYLLFVLDRHHASGWSRWSLGFLFGWLVLTMISTGLILAEPVAMWFDLPFYPIMVWGTVHRELLGVLTDGLFLATACCFLGLAASVRWGKRRVARRRGS